MKSLIRVLAAGIAFVALSLNQVSAQDAAAAGATTVEGVVEAAETDESGAVVSVVLVDGNDVQYKLAGDKAAELKGLVGETVKATGSVAGDAEKTLTISSFEVVKAAGGDEGGDK